MCNTEPNYPLNEWLAVLLELDPSEQIVMALITNQFCEIDVSFTHALLAGTTNKHINSNANVDCTN